MGSFGFQGVVQIIDYQCVAKTLNRFSLRMTLGVITAKLHKTLGNIQNSTRYHFDIHKTLIGKMTK